MRKGGWGRPRARAIQNAQALLLVGLPEVRAHALFARFFLLLLLLAAAVRLVVHQDPSQLVLFLLRLAARLLRGHQRAVLCFALRGVGALCSLCGLLALRLLRDKVRDARVLLALRGERRRHRALPLALEVLDGADHLGARAHRLRRLRRVLRRDLVQDRRHERLFALALLLRGDELAHLPLLQLRLEHPLALQPRQSLFLLALSLRLERLQARRL